MMTMTSRGEERGRWAFKTRCVSLARITWIQHEQKAKCGGDGASDATVVVAAASLRFLRPSSLAPELVVVDSVRNLWQV